jgi:hypothetical protein
MMLLIGYRITIRLSTTTARIAAAKRSKHILSGLRFFFSTALEAELRRPLLRVEDDELRVDDELCVVDLPAVDLLVVDVLRPEAARLREPDDFFFFPFFCEAIFPLVLPANAGLFYNLYYCVLVIRSVPCSA